MIVCECTGTTDATIRAIARAAAAQDYRMSSFILGVVKSDAFRMKRVESEVTTTETKAGR